MDSHSEVVRANIQVHTAMADRYNTEPHFRPENREKVARILRDLRGRCGGGKLLDLGCGTGFIIDLARDLFDEVHGVDVTQAMLDKVDTAGGRIVLHRTPAESLPFPDASFDLVTAYSFLHHVEDYRKVVREAARVLKPGGIFYVDLEPNRAFWQQMSSLKDRRDLPPMVAKARDSVTETDAKVQKEFGIPESVFQQAEYGKAILGGLSAKDLRAECLSLGFGGCTVRYEWFLGQGDVLHGQSREAAEHVEGYLRAIAPLSDSLFKYLQLVLVK